MLPKINRVKKKKDFEVIFKKGASFRNDLFSLRFIKNSLDQCRFGFVVSLKVSKKATERNKIRRRMAGIIKNELDNICPPNYKKSNLDVVIISLPGAKNKEFSDFKESLVNLLVKAKVITKVL
jgi:ribonuclease P protein component